MSQPPPKIRLKRAPRCTECLRSVTITCTIDETPPVCLKCLAARSEPLFNLAIEQILHQGDRDNA